MPRIRTLVAAIALLPSLLFLSSCGNPEKPAAERFDDQTDQSDYVAELKFKLALLEGRWDDALSYCSPELNKAAKTFPSTKQFFEETTPLKKLVDEKFYKNGWNTNNRYYRFGITWIPVAARTNQIPVVINKTDRGPGQTEIWSLRQKRADPNAAWRFDWEPTPLDDQIEERERLRAEWRARVEAFRDTLPEKFEKVELRLSTTKPTFKLGERIPVSVELVNSGTTAVHYVSGDRNVRPNTKVFSLRSASGSEVGRKPKLPLGPGQYGVRGQEKLAAGETKRLYRVYLDAAFDITEPGIYTVQSTGANFTFGDQITFARDDPHGRRGHKPEWLNPRGRPIFSSHGFVPLGKDIPSNSLQFEVRESE